jgi:hypothetical protein
VANNEILNLTSIEKPGQFAEHLAEIVSTLWASAKDEFALSPKEALNSVRTVGVHRLGSALALADASPYDQ